MPIYRSAHLRRGLAALAAAAIVAGLFAVAPATGAAKPLTKKKALKLFYKKADADARFLGGTVYYRQSAPIVVPPFPAPGALAEVACPPGTEVVGGGGFGSGPAIEVIASVPTDGTGAFVASPNTSGAGFTAWGAGALSTAGPGTFRVYAICVEADATDANYTAGGPVV